MTEERERSSRAASSFPDAAGERQAVAARLHNALTEGQYVARPLIASRRLKLSEAYAISADVAALRIADGARRVGRKFGFTNEAIWPRYGVATAIFGDVFDTTLAAGEGTQRLTLHGLAEPRLEPEIVLGLRAAPRVGADPAELASAVGWIAIGCEIVQSVFEGWRFDAAEAVAGGALHGRLFVGPKMEAGGQGFTELLHALPSLELVAERNGCEVARGRGRNALGGPLEALSRVNRLVGEQASHPPIGAGECVTTGTVTDAYPLTAGDSWHVRETSGALPPVTLAVS